MRRIALGILVLALLAADPPQEKKQLSYDATFLSALW